MRGCEASPSRTRLCALASGCGARRRVRITLVPVRFFRYPREKCTRDAVPRNSRISFLSRKILESRTLKTPRIARIIGLSQCVAKFARFVAVFAENGAF
jgi:hypothetical protein